MNPTPDTPTEDEVPETPQAVAEQNDIAMPPVPEKKDNGLPPEPKFSDEELEALRVEQEGVPENIFDQSPEASDENALTDGTEMVNVTVVGQSEESKGKGAYDALSEPEPVSSDTVALAKKKHHSGRKSLLLLAIAGFISVLIAGGSVAAYTLWYQNPKKILADAITNMVQADTISADSTNTLTLSKQAGESSGFPQNVTVKLTGATNYTSGNVEVQVITEIDGKPRTFSAGAQIDEVGTVHVRVDDLKKVFAEAVEASGGTVDDIPEALQAIVDKVDGNWLRIGAEDISTVFGEEAATTYKENHTCVNKAYAAFRDSDEQQQEIIDAYIENGFLDDVTSVGSKDGNLGFSLTVNNKKANDFSRATRDTTVMRALYKCQGIESSSTSEDATFEGANIESDDVPDVKTTIWVSRFGHELKQVEIEVKDDEASLTSTTNLTYNQPYTVSKPSNEVTLASLKKEIEALFLVPYQQIQNKAAATQGKTNAYYVQAMIESHVSNNRGKLPTLTELASEVAEEPTVELKAYPTNGKPAADDDSSVVYYGACGNGTRDYIVGYFDKATGTIIKTSDC